MKNISDIILIELEDNPTQEDIDRLKRFIGAFQWAVDQLLILEKFFGTEAVMGDYYRDKMETWLNNMKKKIVNLSKETKIELFERGGGEDVKKSLGIGVGSPAQETIDDYNKFVGQFSEWKVKGWSEQKYKEIFGYLGVKRIFDKGEVVGADQHGLWEGFQENADYNVKNNAGFPRIFRK